MSMPLLTTMEAAACSRNRHGGHHGGGGSGGSGGILGGGGARKRRRPFVEVARDVGLVPALRSTLGAFFRDNWGILLFLIACAGGLALLGTLAFGPLPWKAWMAFSILCLLLALLIKNTFPTQVAMLLALLAMLAFKVVTPSQALTGFSNTGVATVAVLFVVAEGIQRTSVLLPVFRVLLGKPKQLWVAQLRLMVPVAAASAFLNNTPVVTMMIPVVQGWSRRAGFPIAKLLMPLNNAAILGGKSGGSGGGLAAGRIGGGADGFATCSASLRRPQLLLSSGSLRRPQLLLNVGYRRLCTACRSYWLGCRCC